MKCNHCGKNEAEVHIVEVVDGQRRSLWLCAECSESEQWRGMEFGAEIPEAVDPPEGLGSIFAPGPSGLGQAMESETLASFLGRTGPEFRPDDDDSAPCPHCGHTWARFQQTSRLGCARCYTAFRPRLVPLLAGFHRHVSHLGKTPASGRGRDNKLVELTRLRIALEKAIAGEDFESAAKLRDKMRGLEGSAPGTGVEP